ncbi:CHAP domain-containing protein [Lentzea sp. NPDC004789]
MHSTKSTSAIRRLVTGFTAALAVVSLSTTAAHATEAVSAPSRQRIMNWTVSSLENGQRYQVDGVRYTSTPNLTHSPRYNYLGRNGSNENRNVYTGFSSIEWCGLFAKSMWTIGGQVSNTQLPSNPASSQAWRTDVGNRFHTFRTSDLPEIGDVLVWTNDGDSAHGHVAVVTSVNPTTGMINWIGGNDSVSSTTRDSIVEHRAAWKNMEGSMSGKDFRGFASIY